MGAVGARRGRDIYNPWGSIRDTNYPYVQYLLSPPTLDLVVEKRLEHLTYWTGGGGGEILYLDGGM